MEMGVEAGRAEAGGEEGARRIPLSQWESEPHQRTRPLRPSPALPCARPSPPCPSRAPPRQPCPPAQRNSRAQEGEEEAAPERAGLATAAQAAGASPPRAARPVLLLRASRGDEAAAGSRERAGAGAGAAAAVARVSVAARLSPLRRCHRRAPCPGAPTPPARGPMERSRRPAPPRPPHPAAPLPLLACLLALAVPGRGAGAGESVWRSEQAIGAIAVSRADGVFVASGSCLDQLDYRLQQRLSRLYRDRAGNCTEPVPLAPPARPRPGSSFSKLLLPYREGAAAGAEGLLLTGWTFDRGACEVRPLRNLSRRSLRNGTEVVSCHPQGSTAGVVYRAGSPTRWYLAVAATYVLPEPDTASRCNPAASDRATAIALKDTEGRSLATTELGRLKLRDAGGSLHFVDAFLWNASVYFPYYPYNYTSGAATGWPSMARIAQSAEVLFQGQVALDCGHGHPDGRRLLLSSSLVEALDVWAGVFSAATGQGQERRSPATTALCLFRMSEIQARARSCSWDFETTEPNCVSTGSGAAGGAGEGWGPSHTPLGLSTGPQRERKEGG